MQQKNVSEIFITEWRGDLLLLRKTEAVPEDMALTSTWDREVLWAADRVGITQIVSD